MLPKSGYLSFVYENSQLQISAQKEKILHKVFSVPLVRFRKNTLNLEIDTFSHIIWN